MKSLTKAERQVNPVLSVRLSVRYHQPIGPWTERATSTSAWSVFPASLTPT